jgi:cytochrome c553
MRSTILLLAVAAFTVTAGATTESPYRLFATVQEIMTVFTIPSSDVIFNIAAEPPKDEEQWGKVRDSALILSESTNLLLLPGRVPDDKEEWVKQSKAMIDASAAAFMAAKERDAESLAEAGNLIYDACAACHEKYLSK